jgi:hypothetical protein
MWLLVKWYLFPGRRHVGQHAMKEVWETRHHPGNCEICRVRLHRVMEDMTETREISPSWLK